MAILNENLRLKALLTRENKFHDKLLVKYIENASLAGGFWLFCAVL